MQRYLMTGRPLYTSYLLLGEQCRVDHFHLDGNQSQGLKRQAPPVPVVVLKRRRFRPSPPGRSSVLTGGQRFPLPRCERLLPAGPGLGLHIHGLQYEKTYLGLSWYNQNHVFNTNSKRSVFIITRFWRKEKCRATVAPFIYESGIRHLCFYMGPRFQNQGQGGVTEQSRNTSWTG